MEISDDKYNIIVITSMGEPVDEDHHTHQSGIWNKFSDELHIRNDEVNYICFNWLFKNDETKYLPATIFFVVQKNCIIQVLQQTHQGFEHRPSIRQRAFWQMGTSFLSYCRYFFNPEVCWHVLQYWYYLPVLYAGPGGSAPDSLQILREYC